MSRQSHRRFRFSRSTLAIVMPLAIAVLLNAVIRPWLAHGLGGTMVRSGNAVRGSDRFWRFDALTAGENPALTAFLSVSDGAIAMASLALIALLLLAIWLADRLRAGRSGNGREQ